MRTIIFTILFCSLFTTCKKEKEKLIASPQNIPPMATAGVNQNIGLPTDSVIIDGSGSSDADGKIVSYLWSKIAGPSSFQIINPDFAKTMIKQLTAGVYLFELSVKDNGGLWARDTVQITVGTMAAGLCNFQLSPFGDLSIARSNVLTATAGNKILFAGGFSQGTPPGINQPQTRVDIYDKITQTWATAELSEARSFMSVAVAGNKIFFAGGFYSTRVDIYDASLNRWSTAELSVSRGQIAAASTGDKVIFAGGDVSGYGDDLDVVDIFTVSTNTWSTSQLSEAKSKCSATALHNKIYISGYGPKVDVFDIASNSWSYISLLEPRFNMAAIAVGNTIFWAGGMASPTEYFSKVEMYDVITGNREYHQLSQARASFQAVAKNNQILFFTGEPNSNTVDVYNINIQTWSACQLTQSIISAGIVSTGDKVYVAGGYVNGVLSSQVWTIDF